MGLALEFRNSQNLFGSVEMDGSGDAHLYLSEIRPGAATVALAGGGAGNVDNGVHYYRVTFVTAAGETEAGVISASLTVTDKTSDGKGALSAIPTGSPDVTARRIYRTKAGENGPYLYVGVVSNNTATTFTDNVADSALGNPAPDQNNTKNKRGSFRNAGNLDVTKGLISVGSVVNSGGIKAGVVALDGTNPTSVAHGFGTAIAAFGCLAASAAPGASTGVVTALINGANVDFYAWKPTTGGAAGNPTMIASTGTENIYYIIVGIP